MISLGKCNESCNALSPKKCVLQKRKDTNIKVFNMMTTKNEAQTMTKHISSDCKCKFNSATCNSNQKWNNKTCQCEFENYRKWKKNYSYNPSTCICENSKYLKSIADNSVIKCDEIISAMDIESIKMTNTIRTNASINCHSEKVRCKIDYILHTVLLAIVLLLIIAIISYHYAKHRSKQKGVDALTI